MYMYVCIGFCLQCVVFRPPLTTTKFHMPPLLCIEIPNLELARTILTMYAEFSLGMY